MATTGTGKTARDVMHQGAECIGEHDTLRMAAQMMRDMGVGALPICGDDDRLKGIITDRDIVIKCCAEGKDLERTTAGELAHGLVWVDAGTSVEEALDKMEEHQVKRLPVIENHRIVGMISEADLAKELPDSKLAEFVHRIYARA
ncbi:CBS domain-containing protein [Streptosporangium becharense]|uniref:CBS domain-containing protein n=1 Tax=Streptosporangium becharense TaxID=1816182 RepID=A0A7W9IBV2_9ACTN|nr:CBS domain-containing protein [Streptosporangium becharense]MBB2910851.1 CBS domain-containing protein [Streptosporangium becharense]MBB5817546.1 CBS domain-containing protein [Streptosporangium becharense]